MTKLPESGEGGKELPERQTGRRSGEDIGKLQNEEKNIVHTIDSVLSRARKNNIHIPDVKDMKPIDLVATASIYSGFDSQNFKNPKLDPSNIKILRERIQELTNLVRPSHGLRNKDEIQEINRHIHDVIHEISRILITEYVEDILAADSERIKKSFELLTPSKYHQYDDSEMLDFAWEPTLVLDDSKNQLIRNQKKVALELLQKLESFSQNPVETDQQAIMNQSQSILDSQDIRRVQDAFMTLTIGQHDYIYDSEILDDLWVLKIYSDEAKNTFERQKKDLAMKLFKKLEFLKESQKSEVAPVSQELKGSDAIISSSLSNDKVYQVGEFMKDGYEIYFDNSDHAQDAFAKKGKSLAVCDGSGSYGKSGYLSKALVERLVSQSEGNVDFATIGSRENLNKILEDILQSPEYVNAEPIHVKDENKKDESYSTFTLTKQLDNGDIEYLSLGDSPLVVIDTDDKGNIIDFQIVNDFFQGQPIGMQNYSKTEIIQYLTDPGTAGIGIKGKVLDTKQVSKHIQKGTIGYKKNRKVLLASDFFTKLAAHSPAVWEEKGKAKPQLAETYKNFSQEGREKFPELWTSDGKINPLFILQHRDKLPQLLNSIKGRYLGASDDATIVIMDMKKQENKNS